jgi:hypothetical protein
VITVSLIGGLGNQMFQYAAGKALAERHSVPLALDLSGFRSYALRSFLLNRFQVPEAEDALAAEIKAGASPGARRQSLWGPRFERLLAKVGFAKRSAAGVSYHEPHFHFDAGFDALGPNTILNGYFQSERYFDAIADHLRDWFSPREPLGDTSAAMADRIGQSRLPVSVHVRRGDYLNPGTAEFHGILGEAYYREALGRLADIVGSDAQLFVFSDDADAAAAVLSFIPQDRIVHVYGDPERPWEDMALMARCRHHVIANSSFSWWGAWLNRTSDKTVIAPRAWFAPAELINRNTQDICPQGWMRI